MQDPWKQLKLDSTSWQKTLKNFHNLQNQWLVVSTLCHEMEKTTDPKGWIRGNTKIGPVVEVTTCYLQGKYGAEIRIGSVNKDSSHSWVRISHDLKKLVTDLSTNDEDDDNEHETSEMQFEDFALKRMYLLLRADQRLKQNHEDVLLPAHLQELYLSAKDLGPILSQIIIRPSLTQCQNNWALFFVMVIDLEKMMERLNSGDYKIIFRTILCILDIGLMKSGRASWQEEEATRKDFNVVLSIRTRNSLLPSSSRSFRTQYYWSLITGQCLDSGRFLQVHLSRWMRNQLTFDHQFRIDTGSSKCMQKTDSILVACESYG